MKKIKEINEKFFNKVAKHYDRGLFKKWHLNLKKKVIGSIDIKNNSNILDVGCGTGELLFILKRNKTLNLYGVDISKNMLDIAELKLGKNAILKLVEIEKVKFKDGFFDYVFIVDSFHHFSDYDFALRNIFRILKKDGVLIISDINFGYLGNKIFHIIEPGNNRTFTKKQIIRLLENYGFGKIKYEKIGLFSNLIVAEKL